MATSFASVSLTPSSKSASWCFLMLEHLNELAKLAWYLAADGKLVENTFAPTIAQLDMTASESSIPALARRQARDVLITQAITVLSDARREEDENCLAHAALSAVLKANWIDPDPSENGYRNGSALHVAGALMGLQRATALPGRVVTKCPGQRAGSLTG
jgi:hypothetical protein